MAIDIFFTLCFAGEMFLGYVLVNFIAESRKPFRKAADHRNSGAKLASSGPKVVEFRLRSTPGERIAPENFRRGSLALPFERTRFYRLED